MNFPPFFGLSAQVNSTELFLTYNPEGRLRGYLEFNPTAKVPSLISRFAVEPAGDGLVHIRCCYNNNYWCRNEFGYIVVTSCEKVEDKESSYSTLFRPRIIDGSEVRFTHAHKGYGLNYEHPFFLPTPWNIELGRNASPFKIVHYDLLARLPKRVIFKGDNGQYLRCRRQKPWPIPIDGGFLGGGVVEEESHEYNEFTSKDGSDRSAHYEITHYNGTIRIKSIEFGKFLRRNGDRNYNSWIWGDSDDTTINNLDTLFKVENLGNVIALRNLGNNKVCRRLSADRLDNCLKAMETYVVSEARLVVEEPVSYRKLETQYKIDAAKITSGRLIQYSTATGVNKYKDRDDELSDSFEYNKTRNTSWNRTTTLTKTANAEINIKLPKFVDGKIQLSDQNVEVQHLDKGSTFSEKRTARYSIKVPPMTKAILTGYVREVTYEIPFSYIQTDVYTTGEKATIIVEDGVCQGVEACDYHYEKKYTPL